MPVLHCLKCHHEWEGRATSVCDWCGAGARILREHSDLEMLFGVRLRSQEGERRLRRQQLILRFIQGVMFGMVLGAAIVALTVAARAEKGFDPNNPTAKWFATLKQPRSTASCCGYGDAYQTDIYERHPDGSYTVEITDGSEITYPDGTVRYFIPNGTKIEVPAGQVNPPSDGNPTGHGVLFMNMQEPGGGYIIYCFVPMPLGS